MVAIPPERDPHPVRAVRTFTPDLQALVDWLLAGGIDTVVMEATGVLWIPLYEWREQHGRTPSLVNAQPVKPVPGRKRDWNAAQWLQQRHRLGLLQGSFRPDAEIRAWRTSVRQRADLIQQRAPHLRPLQQALQQLNIQLSGVLSDMMGTTGQASIRALVNGARDPVILARLRHPACHSSEETIAKALTGTWQAEHRCVLQQALALFDFYTEHIAAGDAPIEASLQAMEPRGEGEPPPPDVPPTKPNARSRTAPSFNARAALVHSTGGDLVTVTGLAAASVQPILSEVGTELTRFPRSKPCCSWLGLAPHQDSSGGKVLRAHTRKVVQRAAQAFRQAAQSVARSDAVVGASDRARRARRGPQQAIVATAHTIARVVYHLLKYQAAFPPERIEVDAPRRREREIKHLLRRAHRLGYALTPVTSADEHARPNSSARDVA